MDQATKSAESIKQDTQNLANRFVSIEADERCGVCRQAILLRQFYVFACNHAFHADCLIAETTKHLSPRTLRRILVLQEELSRRTGRKTRTLPPSYAAAIQAAEKAPTSGGNLLGLDKLRELVLPDAIVDVISAGVSSGVASGRKVLAPLDPFADPSASLKAKKVPTHSQISTAQGQADAGEAMQDASTARLLEEEEAFVNLRQELDSLVANACILCDGSVQAIARPFITNPRELEEWEL